MAAAIIAAMTNMSSMPIITMKTHPAHAVGTVRGVTAVFVETVVTQSRRNAMKKLEEVLGLIYVCGVMIFGVVAAAIVYPILLFLDWIMGNKIQ